MPLKPTELTQAVKDLGWRRMALQILYIVPGNIRDPTASFRAIANKVIVGPILKTLVFSIEPEASRAWVDSICQDWAFSRIIPAHFSAPIKAGPAEFKAAFGFLYDGVKEEKKAGAGGFFGGLFGGVNGKKAVLYPPEDIKALDSAKAFLSKAGVVNK